jgi:hypothetical protein
MSATITITVRDALGNKLTEIHNWQRLEYFRKENTVGYMYLDLDPSQVDPSVFGNLQVDYRFEPWRKVEGMAAYLDGEAPFLLKKWGFSLDTSGKERYHLECKDPNSIWSGVVVAYPEGNGKAEFGPNNADNALKVLARENRGTQADDTTRSIATYLSVEVDKSLGPSTYKLYSYLNVLDCMQEIASDSLVLGTYLVFDTVWKSASMLEYRTYTGQRGLFHGIGSSDIVTISRRRKNLEEPELMEDHSNEYNYIYCGGAGEGSSRVIKTAKLSIAMGLSPFNRREKFISSADDNTDHVQAEANAQLGLDKAKKSISGRIVDTRGCMDGVHYRWGDMVYIEYRDQGMNAHIDTLHVTIEQGKETRENRVRSEGGIMYTAWS